MNEKSDDSVRDDIQIINELYNGSLSKVYKIRIGDRIYVKKIVNDKRLFLREVKILQKVSHVNTPQLIHFYEDDIDGKAIHKYVMIQEFIDGMDLRSYVCHHNKLKRDTIIDIMIQILEGFIYLHRHNIYHRDIKPANIMITNDQIVKIIDYGFSCIAGSYVDDEVYCDKKLKGTPNYLAPELFKHDNDIVLTDTPSRPKVDDISEELWASAEVYSVGCILYFLLYGHAPYEGYANEETLYINESKYKYEDIDQINHIVRGLLAKNPQNRLSLEKVLELLKNL